MSRKQNRKRVYTSHDHGDERRDHRVARVRGVLDPVIETVGDIYDRLVEDAGIDPEDPTDAQRLTMGRLWQMAQRMAQ